jgi:hypothetical protein
LAFSTRPRDCSSKLCSNSSPRLSSNTRSIRAARGETPAARLAREHGLTERQIYAIWSTEPMDDGQAALF